MLHLPCLRCIEQPPYRHVSLGVRDDDASMEIVTLIIMHYFNSRLHNPVAIGSIGQQHWCIEYTMPVVITTLARW